MLKKSNRVSPHDNGITDHHDSDHRHRKSRPLKRQKSGRSQRGRPFTQSNLVGGGRVSRGTAYEAQQELAWLDTGVGGVKLMRYQPLPPTTPTFSSSLPPPHPQPPLIQVQPHPQPQAERLPTITSLQSHSYTQRQLETYFKVRGGAYGCGQKSTTCIKQTCLATNYYIIDENNFPTKFRKKTVWFYPIFPPKMKILQMLKLRL